MDHGSSLSVDAVNLSGIRKTLRRVFTPTSEPNEAIIRTLHALARLERIEPVLVIVDGTRLAPAA